MKKRNMLSKRDGVIFESKRYGARKQEGWDKKARGGMRESVGEQEGWSKEASEMGLGRFREKEVE